MGLLVKAYVRWFRNASNPNCFLFYVSMACIETTLYLCILPSVLGGLFIHYSKYSITGGGHAVAQLVEALRYKLEGRGFDSRLFHWIFLLT
jgi:hypothetical protein